MCKVPVTFPIHLRERYRFIAEDDLGPDMQKYNHQVVETAEHNSSISWTVVAADGHRFQAFRNELHKVNAPIPIHW